MPKMKGASGLVVAAVFAGCLGGAVLPRCSPHSAKAKAVAGLLLAKQQVQNQLKNRMNAIAVQVEAFGKAVAADRDFSMKVLVDKDESAPEVTDMAPRFIGPMALSLLSVVNNRDTILSCGQFPASAGGPSQVAGLLADTPSFIMDNVKGVSELTMQVKARFTILDSVFFALGGVIVDDAFCGAFSLPPGDRLLCKQGGLVIGMPDVQSISDVKDDAIVVNNKTYPAVSIALPFSGVGVAPSLIIVADTLR